MASQNNCNSNSPTNLNKVPIPRTLGFLGIGTMNTAIIKGICRSLQHTNNANRIIKFPLILGPATKSKQELEKNPFSPQSNQKKLFEEFGESMIKVVETNSQVMKQVDVVVIGVRPTQIEGLIEEIAVRLQLEKIYESLKVSTISIINLCSTWKNKDMYELFRNKFQRQTIDLRLNHNEKVQACDTKSQSMNPCNITIDAITKCVPLPGVQYLKGTTVCTAYESDQQENSLVAMNSQRLLSQTCLPLFELMGTAISCREAQLPIYQSITGMMGPLYQQCQWLSEFMQKAKPVTNAVSNNSAQQSEIQIPHIDPQTANLYVASFLQTVLADALGDSNIKHNDSPDFTKLMSDQTPGGINEQAIRELGSQKELTMEVLERMRKRVVGG